MTEITLNGTDGSRRFVVVGIDADGNSTGALGHGTVIACSSSDGSICEVSDAGEGILILDPSGPHVGDAVITFQATLENGDILAPNECLVHVLVGKTVSADINPTPIGG